jgi:ketosteroid isomerase-like protein
MDLETRVRTLEDERGVLQLLYRYSYALDDLAVDRFLDCFTPDGVFRTSVRGTRSRAQDVELAGHAEIARWFNGRIASKGDPPQLTEHHVVAPEIHVEGDTATVRAYLAVFYEEEEGPAVQAMARYHDRLQRCDDGQWRFLERHVARESIRPKPKRA